MDLKAGTTIVGRIEIRTVERKSWPQYREALELELKHLEEDMISARRKLLGGNTNE
jgi:hypothetical protein